MIKKILYTVSGIMFFIDIHAYAQNGITADQILNIYVEKIGGVKRWSSIRTTKFRDIVELKNGDSIELVTIKEYPDKYYFKTRTTEGVWTTIYNGGKAVNIHNGKIDTIRDKVELDKLKLQSCILPDMEYKKLGYKYEFVGIQKFNNIDYYEIDFESPNGAKTINFYDKESGLLRMIYVPGGGRSIFTNYKEQEGCMYPYKMLYQQPDGIILDITTKEFSVDKRISPETFSY